MHVKQSRKERYRTDSVYRQSRLDAAQRYAKSIRSDRTRQALIWCRKRIYDKRESIELFLNKIEKLEKDLIHLIKRRDRLVRLIKERKK